MTLSDASTSPISAVLDVMRELASATEPRQVVDTFLDGIQGIHGPRAYLELETAGLGGASYRVTRLRHMDGTDAVDCRDPWAGEGLPVMRGGFLSRMIAHGPKVAIDLSLGGDPALGSTLAPYHSAMATPVYDGTGNFNWAILLHPDRAAFATADLEKLIVRANLVGSMIGTLKAHRRLDLATKEIEREVERIAALQRAMLPDVVAHTAVPGLSVAASYETFDRAGGDLYDLIPLGDRSGFRSANDGRWAVLIGDVSGHGPAAAVMMAIFHAIVHTFARRPAGPGQLLAQVNRHLCKSLPPEMSFITAFLGLYDPVDRTFTYARAGHPPALLLRDGTAMIDEVTPLNAVGEPPLGILSDVRYRQASVRLHPGDTLLLYTDGITEAADPDGEQFDTPRLINTLRSTPPGDPVNIVRAVRDAVRQHEAGTRPRDDQTVVAISVVA